MSFQNVSLPHDRRAATRDPPPPRVVVSQQQQQQPSMSASPRRHLSLPPRVVSPAAPPARRSTYVLHGKVHHVGAGGDDSMPEEPLRTRNNSIRRSMERRSTFAKLSYETEQFCKMVAELEAILNKTVMESPETSWRSRILMQSARDADVDLSQRLFQYEQTLIDKENANKPELRMEQSACLKLHRDYKRAHKGLVMAVSRYEKQQRVEVSTLRAVGWSQAAPVLDQEEADFKEQEEFFDRALRQAELERMNEKMNHVASIYQDLASLVDVQQETIDKVENNISEAKEYVNSAAEQVQCMHDRELTCGAEMPQKEDWPFPFRTIDVGCGSDDSLNESVTITEDGVEIERQDTPPDKSCLSAIPLEDFSDLQEMLEREIQAVGKSIVAQGKMLAGSKAFANYKCLDCSSPCVESAVE